MNRGLPDIFFINSSCAVSLFAVGSVVPRGMWSLNVAEPDALIGHVRFDERGWETERCQMAQATAPILDSTIASFRGAEIIVCYWTNSGLLSVLAQDGSVVNGPQDQGASKPFDFITDNDVGDVINDAKAFAAWI